jgi:uncharacterized membrane protein YhiD involved in acid resistance
MDLNSIFDINFFDNIANISLMDTIISLLASFLVGLFIFYIYKTVSNGVTFSINFGVSLIALTMISSLIILTVTNNVALSLGALGALSIIRFRTAIKDPLDTVFLFWSIIIGIVVAGGMVLLAAIGSGLIGLVLVVFIRNRSGIDYYIVSIICDSEDSKNKALELINNNTKDNKIRSIEVSASSIEMNIMVKINKEQIHFIQELNKIPGVKNAIMVSCNGNMN